VTTAAERIDIDRLVEEWYVPAFKTAVLLLNDRGRAEDAVQEAFLRLWRFRQALPEGEGLRPWVYRVVVNACYSEARSENRHASRRDGADELGELLDSASSPEETADARERAAVVRKAIDALPVMLRVPVVLYYFAGLSEREIATAIHRRPGTVKSRLHSARRLLSGDPRLAAFATTVELEGR
jgi:RNA polymerase sigma-70 factor (ECF subfamily)